ncbi:MAG: nicotinamide mononucleotide transporter [Clostridia bacterium]|nr:nicotinamide mononucleotide transporter [Clostridia bacterium]
MKINFKYFTKGEWALWLGSVLVIAVSFVLFDRSNYLTLAASLIGVTSLIYNAKGNPTGQFLMIIFGALYGIISFGFAYYGEMITYLGMTVPMAIVALVEWLRNPYKGNKSQVAVNRISKKETVFMLALSVVVTVAFYFVLKALGTANIIPSTVSITTSFIAAYLTFRRSPYFALVYAANDVVLIVLWTMATVTSISYLSVIICFVAFFVNDLYGFISWKRMQQQQSQ